MGVNGVESERRSVRGKEGGVGGGARVRVREEREREYKVETTAERFAV